MFKVNGTSKSFTTEKEANEYALQECKDFPMTEEVADYLEFMVHEEIK